MRFKRWAKNARSKFHRCTQEPYALTRAAVLNGNAPSSFVADNLKSILNQTSPFDENVLMCTAGSVYGAATDTILALLMSFVLLMTVFQDIQEKAQAEIATVMGHGNLPGLDDQPSLPYIEALIREIHRFQPVVNLVPHSPLADDHFDGYRIPRKAWLMCNVWSMTHDPELYDDVDTFNPERHLHGQTKDPRDFTFGFGRRVCPGLHFANAETFLFITRVLTLFRVLPTVDETGAEQLPPLSYATAFTAQPKPFACQFEIREPALTDLL